MHIHVGLVYAIGAFASVVAIGTIWRLVAAHNADNAVGQAMSFMY